MIKYLLLRDNKQSGPFVFDELKAKGLKAYDLVWIEGKSAAWRYPSEIEELKPFAPVVEEQPFDRFFKKAVQDNNVSAKTVESKSVEIPQIRPSGTAANNKIAVQTPSPAGNEPSGLPGKRIIYVTMPAGKSAPIIRDTQPAPTAIIQDTLAAPISEAPVRSERPSGYQPSTAGDLFAQNTEELGAIVEMTPRSRKASRNIWRPVAIAASVLVLLAAGIVIGLTIDHNNRFDLTHKLAARENVTAVLSQVKTSEPSAESMAADQAHANGNNGNAPLLADQAATPGPTVSTAVVPASVVKPGNAGAPKNDIFPAGVNSAARNNNTVDAGHQTEAVLKVRKKDLTAGQAVPGRENTAGSSVPKDSAANITSTLQREVVHRAEPVTDKIPGKASLATQVSVGANAYTVGTFGGISDLQITVSNHSVYPLDLVVVEVQYVQANKKVYKTEHINFHDIGAGSALMLEAPKTSRGVKVQYRITFISSKESGLSYSAI